MVSKLEAAIKKKVKIPIKKKDIVLYLGASHGVTPEIIAKLIGKNGFVFCLDISPEVVKKLVKVCEKHENMTALLYDANKPKEYQDKIVKVNIIYQDITQKNQVEIFQKNITKFLKEKGKAIIALKTKSIDSVKRKEYILKRVKNQLEKKLKILNVTDLEPYHKDHYLIICKRK